MPIQQLNGAPVVVSGQGLLCQIHFGVVRLPERCQPFLFCLLALERFVLLCHLGYSTQPILRTLGTCGTNRLPAADRHAHSQDQHHGHNGLVSTDKLPGLIGYTG